MKQRFIFFTFILLVSNLLFSQNWNLDFKEFQTLVNEQQWQTALQKGTALKLATEKEFTKNHLNYTTTLSWLGFALKQTGNFKEAENNYLESLEISKRLLDNNSLDMLYPLQDLAYLFYDKKEFLKAIPYYEQILQLIKTPENHTNYWSYYTDLAQCYYNSNQVEKAIEYYQNLEKNILQNEVKRFISEPKLWTNLGNLHSALGNNEPAEGYLKKSLEFCKKNNQNCVVPLENLGNHYFQVGDYNKALPYYLESFKLQNGSTNYDRYYQLLTENIALCYLNLGDLKNFKASFLINCDYINQTKAEYSSGNYSAWRNSVKSKKNYDLELYILQNHLNYLKDNNPNHSDYPVILYNIGMVYFNNNQLLKAEQYFKYSVDENIVRNANNKNLYQTIKLYSKTLVTNSKYNEAITWFEKCEQLALEEFGPTSIEYSTWLIEFAKLYYKSNELDFALQKIEKASDILDQNTIEPLMRLEIIQTKADIFGGLKQYQRAAPLLAEGLKLSENDESLIEYQIIFLTKIADIFELANDYDSTIALLSSNISKLNSINLPKGVIEILYSRLAFAYYRNGNFNESEKLYKNILPVFAEVYGINHMYYRNALNKYGILLLHSGKNQAALETFLLLENDLSKLSKQEKATLYFNIGTAFKNTYNNDKTIHYYRKFLDIYLEEINDNFLFLSESEKENYVLSVSHHYHHLFNFYHDLEDKTEVINDMYRLHSAFRGMILSASIDLKKQWEIIDNPKTIDLLEQVKAQKNILNQLLLEGNTSQTSDIQNKIDELERELSRNIPDYKNKKIVSSVNFENITQQLNEDEILLDFVQFEIGSLFEWFNDQQYGVFVISGKKAPKYLQLFTQSQLDAILQSESNQDNTNQLYRGSKVSKSNHNNNYGAQLYELIWKPIETYLKPQQAIYYLPSGTLHQIAVAAIPIDNERVLMEAYELYHRNNYNLISQKTSIPENINYLLFGGIDYNANIFGKGNSSNTWSYLDGTKIEIEQLAQSINSNKTIWFNDQATEQIFKENVSNNQPKIIHIATHGFFYSKPNKKPNTINSFNANVKWESSDNPMLRSGLLFAGANYNWQESNVNTAENDGIATALEINNYNLNNTKLVVLSACETGLGDISGSEGVFGLQRAFKNAGAEYLLMSLWKVPDAETAEFMIHFYNQLAQTNNIEESFHNTQKYMKNKYPKDPYNWAAFVLIK